MSALPSPPPSPSGRGGPRVGLASVALFLVLLAVIPARAGDLAREVYVPRADWDQVIAREGKGVVLRYRDLLDLARRGEGDPASTPPVPAAIESATYSGTFAEDAARFEAEIHLRVLAPLRPGRAPPPGMPSIGEEVVTAGAIVIPLGLEGAGVTEALLDGKPAPLRADDAGRTALVLPGEPGERTLKLRFSVRAERRGAERELAFAVPRAAVARLDLDLPQDLDAAPDPPLFERKPAADGRSRLTVALGGAGRFAVSIRPRDEGRPAAPYVTASEVARATILDGAARLEATLEIDIFRAPLEELVLELPEGFSLLDVGAPDLVRFTVSGRRVRLVRSRPNLGRIAVTLAVERTAGADGVLDLRPVRVAGAARMSGIVGLAAERDVRPRVTASEGVEELPASIAAAPKSKDGFWPLRAFGFERGDARVAVRPERVPARASARVDLGVTLDERELRFEARLAVTPIEGRLFRIAALLPKGVEVTGVDLSRADDAYDWRVTALPDAQRVEVELRRGLGATILLRGRASYAGGAALRDLPGLALPVPLLSGMERVSGQIGVGVDPAVKLAATGMRGLEARDVTGFTGEVAIGAPLALAYRVLEADARLAVAVRRETPRLDATVLSFVTVERTRLRLRQEVRLEVARAPIDEVVLLAPPGAGAALHIEGPVVKEHSLEGTTPQGDRIRVRFQGEQRGTIVLFADAEARPEEWTPTGTSAVLVPLVRVERASRDDGTAVVLAGDATEIAVHPKDFPPVGPWEVADSVRGPADGRVLFSFRSALPGRALSLGLTRYPDEPLLTAAVAAEAVDTAVDPLGRSRTLARFDVRNSQNQLLGLALPKGASLYSVLVDGEGARPARTRDLQDASAGEAFVIPLDEAVVSKESVSIEVVYETAEPPWGGSGAWRAQAPLLLLSGSPLPVLEAKWTLRLPTGYRYERFAGTARHLDPSEPAPVLVRIAREDPGSLVALGIVALAVIALRSAFSWLRARMTWKVGCTAVAALAAVGLVVLLVGSVLKRSAGRRYDEFARAPATGTAAREDQVGLVQEAPPVQTAVPAAPQPAPAAAAKPIVPGGVLNDVEKAPRPTAAESGAPVRGEAALATGLRSLTIALSPSPRIEIFEPPLTGAASLELSYETEDRAARSALFFALLGLFATSIGFWFTEGAEWRFLLALLGALTLGGAILGPSWALDVDALLAGALVGAAARLVANGVRGIRTVVESPRSAPPPAARALAILAAATAAFFASGTDARAQERARPPSVVLARPPSPPPGVRVYIAYDPEHPARVGLDGEVFVPHGVFVDLWSRAYGGRSPLPPPPADALLSSAVYEGTVHRDEAAFTATYTIYTERRGTVRVPIGLTGTAIESALLDGAQAALEPSKDGLAALIPDHDGRPAVLVVRFRVRLKDRAVNVPIAPAAAARLSVATDVVDYELEAPSAAGAAQVAKWSGRPGGRIDADLGHARALRLALVQRKKGPGAAEAAVAETSTRVRLLPSLEAIDVEATIRLGSGRAERFRFALPEGVEPLEVGSPAIRAWRVAGEGAARALELYAQEPVTELTARIRAERVIDLSPGSVRIAVAGLPALDVVQERGTIGVFHAASLRSVTRAHEGLHEVDAGALPPRSRGEPGDVLTGAFSFTKRPARLEVELASREAKLTASEDLLVRVEEHRIATSLTLRLRPEGRPLFEAAVSLPPSLELESVHFPDDPAGRAPSFVEESALPGGARTVRLRFPEGRTEPVNVVLALARPLAPEEAAVTVTSFAIEGVPRLAGGELLLATSADLDLGVLDSAGLEPVDPARLERVRAPETQEARLAWRLTGRDASAQARISLRHPAPEIQSTAVVGTTIHADLVECVARILLDVSRSGLERVEVELPLWVGDGASVSAPGLREVSSAEVPSTRFPEGRARLYTLLFQSPVRGPRAIEALFERTEEAGSAVELPAVHVRGAAEERLFLLARTDGLGTARIEEASLAGAEAAARDDLPAFAALGGPDFVLGYLARGVPRVAVRRVALTAREEIEAIVDLADLLTVIDRSGMERTRVRYAIQNRSEQFLELRVPKGSVIWSSFVANEPAKPVHKLAADGERILLPLPKRRRGELSFDVELLIERRLDRPLGWGREVAPEVPEVLNMRVSETFWTVRLPEDLTPFDFSGNLDETAEAIRERHRYEKAVEELSSLNDLLARGNDDEKRIAGENIGRQWARVQEYCQSAEMAQSSASATVDRGKSELAKWKGVLAGNRAELSLLEGKQEELRKAIDSSQRQRAEKALAARTEALNAEEAYERAHRMLAEAQKKLALAEEGRRAATKETVDREAAEKDAKELERSANAQFSQQLGESKRRRGRMDDLKVLEPKAEPSDHNESADTDAGIGVNAGAGGESRKGEADLPAAGPAPKRDESGLGNRPPATQQVGYKLAGKSLEAGRLSLRLALPETGRATHWKKIEGAPALRFRVAALSFTWLLRLARIAALFLVLRAMATLRLLSPERASFARVLATLAAAALAIAASLSAIGAVAAVALGVAVPRVARKRAS